MESNRLLMELERHRRLINRDIIDEAVPELTLSRLEPMLRMVAHARADYIAELVSLSDACQGSKPSTEQLTRLKAKRLAFEELVAAVNALENVVQRDYLTIGD
ncbi:MAG: hypothetical protein OIF57_06175 [Marinobacterium sp.]|nr:hypothetical protein [Marinobacterium sp.]